MSLFEVGRVCVKIAGRDSGNRCVVVEQVDNVYVVVDGNVRRKKVNVKHLEPLVETLDVGNGFHETVKKAFEKLGLTVWERKSKERKERPKKQKAKKEKPLQEKKAVKKDKKTAEKKEVSEEEKQE
ncbi:MAG: 50S ribosomal protein L14e [Nanoarchaeota archaeon]